MTYSPKIENYPGFQALSGTELADKMIEQALSLGAEMEMAQVISAELDSDIKTVHTDSGDFEAKTVIVATGASHRRLGLPHEEELTGNGISYCAVCDGAFFAGEQVCVIGGGNSAMQEALLLSETCAGVTLIQNLSSLTGEKALEIKISEKKNIVTVTDSIVTEYLGQDSVEGVRIKNLNNGEIRDIPCKGVFVAVGLIPATDAFKGSLKLDMSGYIIASENCETGISGVFTAGDCRTKAIRQITTAAADGACAALAACRYLQ